MLIVPLRQESSADARVTRDSAYARQRRGAVIPRRPQADILDIVEPEIAPFDPPTPKTLARTKHGVDRMHRLRDIRL